MARWESCSGRNRCRRINNLQYAVMKPCTCNGSNDNCRYCSGSGYVRDETPLPTQPYPPNNPYLNMKAPTPPYLDPEIWDELVKTTLLVQEEEKRKRQAWRKRESRSTVLVVAAYL